MATAMEKRTVGVLERVDELVQAGYTLLNSGRETYLIDNDGRLVNMWRADRPVFASYLLPNGNLLRDGSENADVSCTSVVAFVG